MFDRRRFQLKLTVSGPQPPNAATRSSSLIEGPSCAQPWVRRAIRPWNGQWSTRHQSACGERTYRWPIPLSTSVTGPFRLGQSGAPQEW